MYKLELQAEINKLRKKYVEYEHQSNDLNQDPNKSKTIDKNLELNTSMHFNQTKQSIYENTMKMKQNQAILNSNHNPITLKNENS